MLRPIEVAIACPEREAELWAIVEDPAFTVNGRPCAFGGPSASVAELREALARHTADVVLVSASLNAIPFETLRDLINGRRAVVLASDPASERWREFPAPVLAIDPRREELAQAIQDALQRQWVRPNILHFTPSFRFAPRWTLSLRIGEAVKLARPRVQRYRSRQAVPRAKA